MKTEESIRPLPRQQERGRPSHSSSLLKRGPRFPFLDFLLIFLGGASLLGLIAWGNGVLAPLRVVLGLAYVLFVPGYCVIAAIFPRQDELDPPERLATSFGLSVAITPILALILDRLPWGIRLWPIIIALGAVILLGAAVGGYRRGRLAETERFRVLEGLDPWQWWRAGGRTERIGGVILAVALAAALAAMGAILFLPQPAERYTEFYLLGAGGLAEDYPREAQVGQAVAVTLGITNREGTTATYRVTVRQDGQPVGQADSVRLAPGTALERSITFAPIAAGADVKIDFQLYRDGGDVPYRSLALWLTVRP